MNPVVSIRRPGGAPGRGLAAVALSIATLALSGCGSRQQLSVRDDNAPSFAVRAAVRPQAWARDERPGPGFEFGVERWRASDVRQLVAGETLVLANQTLTGPDALGQSVVLRRVQVAYTHPLYFGEVFQLEPFVGLAEVRLHYRVAPGASPLRPELRASTTGVIGGITPRARVNDWFAVEARFSTMPSYRTAEVSSHSAEVAAVFTPVRSLALRAGYAQRRAGIEFDVSTNWTQLEVRANGPFATLQFEF